MGFNSGFKGLMTIKGTRTCSNFAKLRNMTSTRVCMDIQHFRNGVHRQLTVEDILIAKTFCTLVKVEIKIFHHKDRDKDISP